MADTRTNNKMKTKMNIALGFLVIVGFGTLVFNLYRLQITDGEFYRSKALAQQLRPTAISAQRGAIYDRTMKTLASSADVWTVIISPAEIKDDVELEKVADFLSPLLDVEREKILQRGRKKGSYYEIIKQRVEEDVADKITAFSLEAKINCINLVKSTKRYYPYGNLASTVLGFTDNDNNGAYGLESYYNKILSGTPGMMVSSKNAKSGNMPFSYDKLYKPADGNSIVLTIDEVIQDSLEKHVQTAVIEHNVKNRAVGIVMDVKTGAILGMTTKPDFDPNEPSVLVDPAATERLNAVETDEVLQAKLASITDPAQREQALKDAKQTALQAEWYGQWRNKAVSDPYEPGSVFKIITSTMALDLNVVKPTGQNFYCPGYHIVAGRRKACWSAGGHGDINFTQAVKFSCNPAFMMVGALIGAQNFYDYFDRFGLREPTGIDLPSESEGFFYDLKTLSKPSGEELASSSFGQSFKVTPLQMITAVCTAVNGGKQMQPYVVGQVIDPEGNVISTTEPVMRRQVISEATSKTMSEILQKVVGDPDGSGRFAYVPGYRVGGKTGTSEKLDKKVSGDVAYRISSFLGVAPCDDPQIAVLVILDEPHMQNIYGSVIAAPVVGAIMADILPYIGIEPRYTPAELAEHEVLVPTVTGKIIHDAIVTLTAKGLKYKISGDGINVTRQLPPPGEVCPKGGTVIIYTGEQATPEQIIVPEVVGMTGQQANRTILNSRLNFKIVGEAPKGTEAIVSQLPMAGTSVNEGTIISVSFTSELQEAPPKTPIVPPPPQVKPPETPAPEQPVTVPESNLPTEGGTSDETP